MLYWMTDRALVPGEEVQHHRPVSFQPDRCTPPSHRRLFASNAHIRYLPIVPLRYHSSGLHPDISRASTSPAKLPSRHADEPLFHVFPSTRPPVDRIRQACMQHRSTISISVSSRFRTKFVTQTTKERATLPCFFTFGLNLIHKPQSRW